MARDVIQTTLTEEAVARKVAVVRIHHLQLSRCFEDQVYKLEREYSVVGADLVYNSVGFLMRVN